MDRDILRTLLDLTMVSDPWPLKPQQQKPLLEWIDRKVQAKGYSDWVEAYHKMPGSTAMKCPACKRAAHRFDVIIQCDGDWENADEDVQPTDIDPLWLDRDRKPDAIDSMWVCPFCETMLT